MPSPYRWCSNRLVIRHVNDRLCRLHLHRHGRCAVRRWWWCARNHWDSPWGCSVCRLWGRMRRHHVRGTWRCAIGSGCRGAAIPVPSWSGHLIRSCSAVWPRGSAVGCGSRRTVRLLRRDSVPANRKEAVVRLCERRDVCRLRGREETSVRLLCNVSLSGQCRSTVQPPMWQRALT